jgi:hypothetical protein
VSELLIRPVGVATRPRTGKPMTLLRCVSDIVDGYDTAGMTGV